ncbi:MAG TPA: hypothetical protein VGD37_08415 [Kofleriaceae bacterium]|jgi:hypothetical protein
MLKKLSMCLVLAWATGVGCKGNPVDRGADLTGGGGPQTRLSIQPALRGKVTVRPDGTFAVSSPDGTQVLLLKSKTVDGSEVGAYQVCDATGTTLHCGDWIRIDTPCTQCAIEPCPCTNPVCAPVCKPL